MASSTILIVEDETAQAEVLTYNLEASGYSVIWAERGEDGIDQARLRRPDIILLDWMLPDMPGVDVCKILKSDKDTRDIPIMMLTARGSEDDKVRGLMVGADDYVTKPYSNRELIARINANMRRYGLGTDALVYAGIEMNTETHRVTRDGNPIKLGPTEFRLLRTLLSRPKKVYSRAQLLDQVWGMDIHIDERTVDVHMGRLRRAINFDDKPDLVRTIRGAGYALDKDG